MATNTQEPVNHRGYIRVQIVDPPQVIDSSVDLRASRIWRRSLGNIEPYDFRDSERADRCLNALTVCLVVAGATGWLLHRYL